MFLALTIFLLATAPLPLIDAAKNVDREAVARCSNRAPTSMRPKPTARPRFTGPAIVMIWKARTCSSAAAPTSMRETISARRRSGPPARTAANQWLAVY